MNKLIVKEEHKGPYGLPNKGWTFVTEQKKDYVVLQSFLTCKDYMHEVIGSKVNDKRITTVFENYEGIHIDKLLMAMTFDKKTYPDIKKRIFLTMAYIQRFEAFENVPLTHFKELSCDEVDKNNKETAVFLIEGDITYIESPVLLHWMIATLRTMPYSSKLMAADFDFDKICRTLDSGDATILRFMHKHEITLKLMHHHIDKVRSLGLKGVYPKDVDRGSYHTSFGIWSACGNKLGSPKYREAINSIFKEENIPYLKN